MARIVLAPGLRPLCDGQAVIELDVASANGLIDELVTRFPSLSTLAGDDRSNWAIELFLNGVTLDKGMNSPISATDEIVVFHPIAGG